MRYVLILFLCFSLPKPSLADERKTLFEGLGARIISIADDMTDEISGVIFLDFGPVYMAVYGDDNFVIWADSKKLLFSHDSTHLIRVGKNRPFALTSLNKRNGLKPVNMTEAASVIQSLAKGETVKLRYYDWPRYNKIDRKLENVNFGFIYCQAVEFFEWEDLDVTCRLSDVKLDVYKSEIRDGYAKVTVVGNRDLSLTKEADKYGGGAHITVGINRRFGYRKGMWFTDSVDILGLNHLVVRDSTGRIVFKELLPESHVNTIWPGGETAARKAWEVAPPGSIEIEDLRYGKRALLYGFRELWKWRVDNAGLPLLE